MRTSVAAPTLAVPHHDPFEHRRSYLQAELQRDGQRRQALADIRADVERVDADGKLNAANVHFLFADRQFAGNLFALFDVNATGALSQDEWIDTMKINLRRQRDTGKTGTKS